MKSDLEQKQLRAIQYWYVDGTFEFSMAGIFLLLALYFGVMAKFEDTPLGGLLSASMILVFVFGSMGINWMVMRMKERITFPRTGYVAYKRVRGAKRIAKLAVIGAISGVIAALVGLFALKYTFEALMLMGRPFTFNWMPVISGVLIGIAAGILSLRTRILRFAGTSLLSIAVGVLAMFVTTKTNEGLALYYGLLGAILLIFGVLVLRKYLSTAPQTESDHEQ